MAEQLIATLNTTFDPSRHSDTHREAVLELIERKAAGERSDDLLRAPAPSSDKVIDLMAALEASVNEAKKARQRHPACGSRHPEFSKAADEEQGCEAVCATRAV